MQDTQDVTRLLDSWRRGDPGAADRVFSIVYGDLRAIARRQLARLGPGRTLVPTALVHEAYLGFAGRTAPLAIDRDHFLAVAAAPCGTSSSTTSGRRALTSVRLLATSSG